MSFRAPMSDEQRVVLADVLTAIGGDQVQGLRERLHPLAKGVWLPAPLLTAAAALVNVVVDARVDDVPWLLDEALWDEYLPDRRPAGRSEWRNANFAVHAAGCLAAGVWLDVGRQESFWHLPLWPFALDVIELLTNVALAPPTRLTLPQVHGQLLQRLHVESTRSA